MPFATKKGAFLVKGGKFCTTCCKGGGERSFVFISASVALVGSSWYTARKYDGWPSAGDKATAKDAAGAAEEFASGGMVIVEGCSTLQHSDCSCNGNTRRRADFKLNGPPSADKSGVYTAKYTFDACPGTYSTGTRVTHQITILFKEEQT